MFLTRGGMQHLVSVVVSGNIASEQAPAGGV